MSDYFKYPNWYHLDDKPMIEWVIPSKSIRKYHEKINHKFSDFEMAGLIVTSNLPYFRKINELLYIGNNTKDEELKEQIEIYTKEMAYNYNIFIENDFSNFAYILKSWDYDQYDDNTDLIRDYDGQGYLDYYTNGCFLDFCDIIEILKEMKVYHPNSLHKITKVRLYTSDVKINKSDSSITFPQFKFGTMYFGYGYNFSNLPIYFSTGIGNGSSNKKYFWNKYIDIPYPFKPGNKIKVVSPYLPIKPYNGIFEGQSYEDDKKSTEKVSNYLDITDTKHGVFLNNIKENCYINILYIEFEED